MSPEQRLRGALAGSGSAVTSGIALTKLFGVLILARAHTQVFFLYYFKFYIALVVTGFLHGIVLLPVLLLVAGPEIRA